MSTQRLQQLYAFHEADPKDSFILFALAKEHESISDDEKALNYYLQLVQNDPDYVGTYYHLGKLYERIGQPTQAFATYCKGMKIARAIGDQHAFNELAEAKLQLGDDEDFD
jgi:tetratricopeptide (TPR) repeat protein